MPESAACARTGALPRKFATKLRFAGSARILHFAPPPRGPRWEGLQMSPVGIARRFGLPGQPILPYSDGELFPLFLLHLPQLAGGTRQLRLHRAYREIE